MIIYNLFPLMAGQFSNWKNHLGRASEMGFSWIFINPFQRPFYTNSLKKWVQTGAPFVDLSPEHPMTHISEPFSCKLEPGQGIVLLASRHSVQEGQRELGGLNMLESEGHIAETRDEAHDVKTFVIEVAKRIAFAPGQYCMVSMPENKGFQEEWRPFTFVSIPEDEYIELTVKRMGAFTTAMHNMHPGDKLRLKGPFGEQLNFDESVKDDVVFVAGGSGITPFMSAMRFAASRNMPNRIILLYSNKTIDDIIYKDELEALGQRENITVTHSLTKRIPAQWKGIRGRLNKDAILNHVESPKKKLWDVCGPPPMVKSVREMLADVGVPEQRLRIEDWQIPAKG